MNCQCAEDYVLEQLRQHLPANLYYHGPHHTLDVVARARALADAEGITDPEQLALLRTAAFYHDAGFLTTYQGHEAAGCKLVRQLLPNFGYSSGQVDFICGLIMATQVPQSPGDSLPAQILCDADLDYLGRPDFWPISHSLRNELSDLGLIESEQAWQQLQLSFLQQHQYWTRSALSWREANKQDRILEVQALLNTIA
ncbi:HD domain-containing protein [Hymenobacter sediminicola]|uniref:HD domain-containing protein n=1 Tax=Hymenobacter sediminicola TaxID=2761579 RepID=A0A7G7W285_9BACT|nr:HD domain-containing protein [Hymenobacter sediminicola]QNH60478.1 HD domain-containing protein [Hymenobacter sediminicola]